MCIRDRCKPFVVFRCKGHIADVAACCLLVVLELLHAGLCDVLRRDVYKRQAFAENAQLDVGKRTKKAAELVKAQILALAPELDADKLAKKALENAGIKSDDKGDVYKRQER